MKFLMALAICVSLHATQAYAINEVLYTCSAENGVGFVFPLRRGNSNPSLVISTQSTRVFYPTGQYQTAILEGEMLDPHHLLILDLNGNRLIEKKDGKLIDAEGNEHELSGCSIDA